jgi:hypothetical protein
MRTRHRIAKEERELVTERRRLIRREKRVDKILRQVRSLLDREARRREAEEMPVIRF